ncbi:ankyrin, partial [Fragilariopsis cylindrus CCMP1102]
MRPIHWACTEGSIPHTALLLKNGAEMEAKDNSGCTPLLISAQYGQVEVVAYLLKKNANLQAVDTSYDTALHWAAYKGSIEVCGLLAYYRQLSFATQDQYGQTPLHLAALRGHTSVVRYILQ